MRGPSRLNVYDMAFFVYFLLLCCRRFAGEIAGRLDGGEAAGACFSFDRNGLWWYRAEEDLVFVRFFFTWYHFGLFELWVLRFCVTFLCGTEKRGRVFSCSFRAWCSICSLFLPSLRS